MKWTLFTLTFLFAIMLISKNQFIFLNWIFMLAITAPQFYPPILTFNPVSFTLL